MTMAHRLRPDTGGLSYTEVRTRRYKVGLRCKALMRWAEVYAEAPDEVPAAVAEQEGAKWETIVAVPWEYDAPEPVITEEEIWT